MSPEAVSTTRQVRAYRFLAIFVGIGLLAAFVIGALGATGPGVLTPESAFLVAGIAILVLALALVYLLVTYRNAFTRFQVHHAMLKALEADVRTTATDAQTIKRQSAADRARWAGVEPRVAQTAEKTNDLLHRIDSVQGQQRRLDDVNASMARDLVDVRSRDEQLALRVDATSNEVQTVSERIDGLEYTTSTRSAETATQVEWLTAENEEHTKRASMINAQVDHLEQSINRLATTLAALEERVRSVESEEDAQDYRSDALDQRLAVVELEVANAPRLTRTLETRLGEIASDVAGQQQEFEAFKAERPEAAAPVTVVADASPVVEERLRSVEVAMNENAAQIARLAAELSEHEKHPAPVTISDLRTPTITPVAGDDDLAAIEGIGSVFRARLRENAVRSYDDLRAADADSLAPRIGTHTKTFRGWQAMAELMQIHGVDHQIAELLVRIGIRSREELAQTSARTIVEKVVAYNESHEISLHPRTLDDGLAKKWIDAAQPGIIAKIG